MLKDTSNYLSDKFHNIFEGGTNLTEKYNEQVNVKISHQMRVLLRIVSKFETIKMSELVRKWINERLNTYMRNPQFKRWLKFNKEEAEELGEIRP